MIAALLPQNGPLDFQILGKTLLHAVLVGVGTGLIGAAFFGTLEYVLRLLLEQWAGYVPLRAHGERFVGAELHTTFRPWLIVLIPAVGALLAGLVMRLAPEVVIWIDGEKSLQPS